MTPAYTQFACRVPPAALDRAPRGVQVADVRVGAFHVQAVQRLVAGFRFQQHAQAQAIV